MKERFHKFREFLEKYEGRISFLFLIGGFIFDNLTLQRVDQVLDIIIVVIYLGIAGGSIIFLNYFKEYEPHKNFFIWMREFFPFAIQFTLGGLFSVFLVFYSRSAAISSSWPFLVFLLLLLVGNEFFRNYYHRLTFQIAIYYVAILSFSILILPVLLKHMNAGIFLLSGLLSLVTMTLFTRILLRVVSRRYKSSRVDINRIVAGIFIVVNILYFTNLIPPIPLAMKDSGVYYSVTKSGENSYELIGEERGWYESIPFLYPTVMHLGAGEPVYVFSAVFAPTGLSTNVVHDWQHFDEETGKWVSVTKITFNIVGGRNDGYRVFSKKESLVNGKWRVDVKTERGQIIGRIGFSVEPSSSAVVFEKKVL